jgi:hypothetical protein
MVIETTIEQAFGLKSAAMLSSTRRVCTAMSPETISPDFGRANWPLQNKRPLRILGEYDRLPPALAGEMGFFMWPIVTGNLRGTMNRSHDIEKAPPMSDSRGDGSSARSDNAPAYWIKDQGLCTE